MPDALLERRLAVLLSWRARARHLEREAEEAHAQGLMEREQYDSLRAFYRGHERQANDLLHALRERERPAIEKLGNRLRSALRKQERLAAQAASGGVKPHAANREAHGLARVIEELRGEISAYNRLLSADSADDAGGFVDLPIEEYRGALAAAKSGFRFSYSDRITLLAALAVIVVASGAMWYYYRGRADVVFEASAPETRHGIARVYCENRSSYPILLYLPWPEGERPRELDGYGADVYVLHEGGSEYRRLANTQTAWAYQGMLTSWRDTPRVAPGLRIEALFSLAQALPPGQAVRAVRIDCTRSDGQVAASFTFNVGQGPTRASAFGPLNSAPPR